MLGAERVEARFPWLWDPELDSTGFEVKVNLCEAAIRLPHDRTWALLRLIEYAPYANSRRFLTRDH